MPEPLLHLFKVFTGLALGAFALLAWAKLIQLIERDDARRQRADDADPIEWNDKLGQARERWGEHGEDS